MSHALSRKKARRNRTPARYPSPFLEGYPHKAARVWDGKAVGAAIDCPASFAGSDFTPLHGAWPGLTGRLLDTK